MDQNQIYLQPKRKKDNNTMNNDKRKSFKESIDEKKKDQIMSDRKSATKKKIFCRIVQVFISNFHQKKKSP
jgi:hypothetical protein